MKDRCKNYVNNFSLTKGISLGRATILDMVASILCMSIAKSPFYASSSFPVRFKNLLAYAIHDKI